jgi:hypothetical protein
VPCRDAQLPPVPLAHHAGRLAFEHRRGAGLPRRISDLLGNRFRPVLGLGFARHGSVLDQRRGDENAVTRSDLAAVAVARCHRQVDLVTGRDAPWVTGARVDDRLAQRHGFRAEHGTGVAVNGGAWCSVLLWPQGSFDREALFALGCPVDFSPNLGRGIFG